MRKLNQATDILSFGLFLYYVVTGGAIIPMNEFEQCNLNEATMSKLVPVRFGETIKEVLRLSLYHSNNDDIDEGIDDGVDDDVGTDDDDEEVRGGSCGSTRKKRKKAITMNKIVTMLQKRISEIELITELYQARVLLLDNALNVIDSNNENGYYKKKDVCQGILSNSTVKAILSQDIELHLLLTKPERTCNFIMNISTKRGDQNSTYVEADDILNLVSQMMITKNRNEMEENRIKEEEKRILLAEMEFERKNNKKNQ